MRLTIVDRTTFQVSQVIEFPPLLPEPTHDDDIMEWLLRDYSHSDYVWFVSLAGEQPRHAQHNSWGQIVNRHTRLPISHWS